MLPANASSPSFLLAHLIDAVRINVVSCEERSGKPVWIKHRRALMDGIIVAGNIFLHLSNSQIQMFPHCREWLEWELHCFELLHGDRVRCGFEGDRGFWVEALPGESLLQILERGDLSLPMMRAAAREFSRAHSLFCPQLEANWSHGDPHLANVLYDMQGDCAYLIDFETQHRYILSTPERQADDLLVLILDLMGRLPSATWLSFALEFLQAYDLQDPLGHLKQRLLVPHSLE